MTRLQKILSIIAVIIVLGGLVLFWLESLHTQPESSQNSQSAPNQIMKAVTPLCNLFGSVCKHITGTQSVSVSSQTGSGPEGFASLNGGVTGGDPSQVCHVTSVATFASCAESAQSSTVVFDVPTLTFSTTDRPIFVNSNKTIEGPVAIEAPGDILYIAGEHNILIQDISFENLYGQIIDHPLEAVDTAQPCPDPDNAGFSDEDLLNGCGVPITITGSEKDINVDKTAPDNSHNIWIDHNTFSECGNKCIAVQNSSETDPTGRYYGATDISVSNNILENTFYAMVITIANSAADARKNTLTSQESCEENSALFPEMDVSVYDNLFNNVRRRSARVVYCSNELHEFNNVVENWGEAGSCSDNTGSYGFGPSSDDGAQLLLENNYLSARSEAGSCLAAVNDTETWGGDVREVGDIFANGAQGAQSNPGVVFTPPYSYTLLPADQVFSWVTAHAGADL